MIVPNENYRPNPDRCVYIDGPIDEQLISRVTPVVLRLQRKSRHPITAYIINSPGGQVERMESILKLLQSSDQDSSSPCRIITVVTRRAGSAAADLLCSGDYAIAYQNSTILYHGVRTFETDPLTLERTSVLTSALRLSSDYYAWDLAHKIESRFMFLFFITRPEFDNVRHANPGKAMTDFDCFLQVILSKLSQNAKTVCENARTRYGRYAALLTKVKPKPGARKRKQRQALLEAKQLRAILDFEVAENRANPNWTFRLGGLTRLSNDFYRLTEYLEGAESRRLKQWCEVFGPIALTKPQKDEIDRIEDDSGRTEKMIEFVQPAVQPLWSFFVALCHALQEGENLFTAKDAYWLGLIDEVMGDPDLAKLRNMMEYQEDKPKGQPQGEKATTGTTGDQQVTNKVTNSQPAS